MFKRLGAALIARAIGAFAWVVTGVRGNWVGTLPSDRPCVYFANHVSHGDFVLIWSVLPAALRRHTRAVAGADYWQRDRLRRFIGTDVFNVLLIAREREGRTIDPVQQMAQEIGCGQSLILFPEGTRNTTEATLLAFKSGLYHLGRQVPDVDLVPVWIENLGRVMPKGEFLPIPLLCTVHFGAPIRVAATETKDDFLVRARAALLQLAPAGRGGPAS